MKKILIILQITALFIMISCNHDNDVNCSKVGTRSLFVAKFEGDPIGSRPAPPTNPLHYGPPGASLEMQGGSNTIKVVNSAALASKALRITRGVPDATKINAVVGDLGEAPYTTGVYYIRFRAHGEVVPTHSIAGMVISVLSTNNKAALALKLYDGSYHLLEVNSYVRLSGTYDPSTAHTIHIILNLNTRKFSVCIDGKAVASNKTLLAQDFTGLHSLQYWVAPTITEAFESTYTVDDIRITK